MAKDDEGKKRREFMRDLFDDLLDLHKKTLLVAIELHKAMEEDHDQRGIQHSKEFLDLMRQQRTLMILGMVHKVNSLRSEEEGGKLIPFPTQATRENMEATIRQYIPRDKERLAKEHAAILRMAAKTGYYAWSLPKSCVQHVKNAMVTTYDCANCNVLRNARLKHAEEGKGYDLMHHQLFHLYEKWSSWVAQFGKGEPKRREEIQEEVVSAGCAKHLREHFAEQEYFDGVDCYGCPVIRQSFAPLQKNMEEKKQEVGNSCVVKLYEAEDR